MNCEKIKQKVGIRMVLESFNLFPVKENGRTAFYFALDREEKIPSLSVDFIKNKAFDFGTGNSYDVISIVQQMNTCSVSEALKYLGKFDFSIQPQKQKEETGTQREYRIFEIKKMQHPALIQYLKTRKVDEHRHLVKELHYELKGKKYFGIGFENDSGGFEVRNSYSKICVGRKDVTLIQENKKEIAVFEGFLDYLTFKNIEKTKNCDYLILNSTVMLFKVVEKLNDYDKIYLFLDNDSNGNITKNKILMKYENVEDCSLIYRNFKDLNEWFCKRKL